MLLHYQRHRGYLSTADLPTLRSYQQKPNKVVLIESGDRSDESTLTDAQKEVRGLNNSIRSTRERLGRRTISELQLDILEGKETHLTNRAVRAKLSPPNALINKISDVKAKGQAERNQKQATTLRYDRWMYVEEFARLWATQAQFHPELTDDLRKQIESLVFHQNPLSSKEAEVGFCELLPKCRRCRVGELVFQRHRILAFLAHTSVDGRKLTTIERRAGVEFLITRDKAKYSQLKQALGLPDVARFADEPLPEKIDKAPGRGKKRAMAAGRDVVRGSIWGSQLAQVLAENGVTGADLVNGGVYDALVHDLLTLPEGKILTALVDRYGLSEEMAILLAGLQAPQGYAKRCSRVLRRIEPHLYEQDDLYRATAAAGYVTADKKISATKDKLEVPNEWTTGNPSVDTAVRWSAKVINQIVERYGRPTVIRVELPRQMAMGNEQRAEEWKRINDRATINEEYRKKLCEHGREDKPRNILRLKLAEESEWHSPYEPEQTIGGIDDLIDNYEVDHIVPQSYSADDGFGNLVLCPSWLNQQKGNQTPYEAFGPARDPERWAQITKFVSSCRTMPRRKRERILATSRPEQNMEARMLTQMGYVGTQITSLLRTLKDVRCEFVNGSITAEVRRRYGLDTLLGVEKGKAKIASGDEFASEKNRSDLRHHALDAACILLIDRSMAQRLTRYFEAIEDWRGRRQKGEKPSVLLEEPFPDLRAKIGTVLSSAPVVHPPRRKASGPLHKETMLPLADFVNEVGEPNTYAVRSKNVLRFGPDGKVSGAWLKGTVHHGIIYSSLSGKRSISSVSLFEVANRLKENAILRRQGLATRSVIDKTSSDSVTRFYMSVANGDTVEYTGSKGAGPSFYRVGTIAIGAGTEISLFPVRVANSDPKAPTSVRATSQAEWQNLKARVVLNIFGEVIFREPPSDH